MKRKYQQKQTWTVTNVITIEKAAETVTMEVIHTFKKLRNKEDVWLKG